MAPVQSRPVIAAMLYRDGAEPMAVDVDALDQHCAAHDGVLWVHIAQPSAEHLHHVAEEFSLHPLALESALQVGERSKVEIYPTHQLLVVHDHEGGQLCLFIGPRWLVSVANGDPLWSDAPARSRFEQSSRLAASPASLIYTLLDTIVDGYEDHVEALANRVEAVEEQVLDRVAGDERSVEQQVLALRRQLITLRRRALPVRDLVQELRRGRTGDSFDDNEIDLGLADVADHVNRIVEQLDTNRELLGSAFDAHLAAMSNQMNLVMKQLSAWGAIAIAATLIAGIYGMNFTHMPELHWAVGYPLALGLMFGLGALLYRMFKRRDWL